jgi:hypothetical protein
MVVMYLTTAIGIPVYMHYCGGELEKVSYLIKTKGCCGSEDNEEGMNDCCQDENLTVRYAPDFTTKKVVDSNFQIADLNLFVLTVSIFDIDIESTSLLISRYFFPPPDILHSNIIRTTFLRI